MVIMNIASGTRNTSTPTAIFFPINRISFSVIDLIFVL